MPNFNNINCQKCKKLLSIKNETESSYILTCDSCNTSVTLYKTETDKTEIPSVKDTLKHTPEIITKPYGILINLIENDEIYGALLKLKDVFELVIKLPLVIILSQTQKRIIQEDEDFNTALDGTLALDDLNISTYKADKEMILKAIIDLEEFNNSQYIK